MNPSSMEYIVDGYIVAGRDRRWWQSSLRARWVAKSPRRLAPGEVPIRVVLTVPAALFEKPTYEIRATVGVDTDVVLGELRAHGIEVMVIAPPAEAAP